MQIMPGHPRQQRLSALAAEQVAAQLQQVAHAELAVAVLVQHAAEQTTGNAALLLHLLLFLAKRLAERAGIGLATTQPLGEEGHHDRREDLQQLAGAAAVELGGLGQAGFHLLLAAAEDVAEDAGAIAGGTTTTSAQHRTEHAAQVQAAVVVLQRAEQGLRPLRLRGVVAQRAHQHRQRGADRAGGLGIADAELLRHLLQRSALQFGEKRYDADR
ncbi:hypothetical protein G6F57_013707 [Rhizopus arrhizus]|nr:hypothetical protein G6F57_013707 [Rhizopus arrhizus]